MYDYIIIGAGLVGLGVARALQNNPASAGTRRQKILILEKETAPAQHQSGHNSNVVHSGIYYTPGSLKARLAALGNASTYAYCQQHGLYYDRCGKIIVATSPQELPLLDNIQQRGLQNGLTLSRLNRQQLQQREPYVNGLAAILVPDTGIVSFSQIAQKQAELFLEQGGEIHYQSSVCAIKEYSDYLIVNSQHTHHQGRWLINCAGLHSDRIAILAGYNPGIKIIPFRGEYFVLNSEKNHLVNHLIYPVPDPAFPFLGVHFTRMWNGEREVGPNAVLAFKREGYRKQDISPKDLLDTLTYPGFWKLAGKYAGAGLAEMRRSYCRQWFTRNAQKLIPALRASDISRGPAGVRAQALAADGTLLDDFCFIKGQRSLHVCNAPSPAATASMEIGREIVRQYFS